MSEFSTLGINEADLAREVGIDLIELEARERPRSYDLGHAQVDGVDVWGSRAIQGSIERHYDDGIVRLERNQGGSRIVGQELVRVPKGMRVEDFCALQSLKLANGMISKRGAVGVGINGSKFFGITSQDPREIPYPTMERIIDWYALRMNELGLAGIHGAVEPSVIAPDLNTGNPRLMNRFSQTHWELSGDVHHLAAAGGKSVDFGGNEFRGFSTSKSTYLELANGAQQAIAEGRSPVYRQQTVKIQGLGNVGAPMLHFMRRDPDRLTKATVLSDYNAHEKVVRTLSVPEDSDGIELDDDAIHYLVDHPEVDRVQYIAGYIEKHNPRLAQSMEMFENPPEGPQAIFNIEADWVVLAANGGALNEDNVPVYESGNPAAEAAANKIARFGCISGANHGVTDGGHGRLRQFGKIIRSGDIVNPGGTLCTDIEVRGNIISADTGKDFMFTGEESEQEVAALCIGARRRIDRLKTELEIVDDVQAVRIISLAQRALWHNMDVDSRIKPHLVLAEAA